MYPILIPNSVIYIVVKLAVLCLAVAIWFIVTSPAIASH